MSEGTKPGSNVGKWGKKVEIYGHEEACSSSDEAQATGGAVLRAHRAKNRGATSPSLENSSMGQESDVGGAGMGGSGWGGAPATGVDSE